MSESTYEPTLEVISLSDGALVVRSHHGLLVLEVMMTDGQPRHLVTLDSAQAERLCAALAKGDGR